MQNLFWYIGLAVVGVVCAAYAIFMKRNVYKVSTLVVFYLFSAGLSWLGEFIVLGIFNSYAYKTGLFANPWAQNLLGHLILNTSLYPAAATVMAAYSLRHGWVSLVAALFILIEYLFIKINLYEHHWWTYYMTVIAVIIYLSFSRIWFVKMIKNRQGLTRAVTFFFAGMLIIHTPAPLLLLLGKQHYQLDIVNNLIDNLYLSSIIITFSYHLIEVFLAVLFTCILKKWYWKVPLLIVPLVAQGIFAKMNILILKNGWNLVYTILIFEISMIVFVLGEKYTLRSDDSMS